MAALKDGVDLYENSNAITDSSLDAFIRALLGDIVTGMKCVNVGLNKSKGHQAARRNKKPPVSKEKILQIIILDHGDDDRSSGSEPDQTWNEITKSESDVQSCTYQQELEPSETEETNIEEGNGSKPISLIKSRSKSGSSVLDIFRGLFKRSKRNSSPMLQTSSGYNVKDRKPRNLKFWRKSKTEIKAEAGILNKGQMEAMEELRKDTSEEEGIKGKYQCKNLHNEHGDIMKKPLSLQKL